MGAVAASLAEHHGVGERSRAGGDVNWSSTGEIEAAELVDPSRRVPRPAGNRIIDDGGPDEHEDESWQNATALGSGADREGNCNACEHALVDGEEEVWDLG